MDLAEPGGVSLCVLAVEPGFAFGETDGSSGVIFDPDELSVWDEFQKLLGDALHLACIAHGEREFDRGHEPGADAVDRCGLILHEQPICPEHTEYCNGQNTQNAERSDSKDGAFA